MRIILCLTIFVFTAMPTHGQSVNSLVEEGIAFHDAGNFEMAIEKYKEALEIDANSSLVKYELALSYRSVGDLQEAMKYSKQVFKKNDDHFLPAAIIYASILDDLGKPNKAIQIYKKALKRFPDHYLLNFNIAITFSRIGEREDAGKYLTFALQSNFTHPGSHFALGELMRGNGRRIESLLSAYFFLSLEPATSRTRMGFDLLYPQLSQNVRQEDANNITISLSPESEGNAGFGAAELMLGLSTSATLISDKENRSEAALFAYNTGLLFSVLSSLKEGKEGFWWENYVTFYADLDAAGHTEAFCYYITQNIWEESEDWLENHDSEYTAFIDWVNQE